MRIETRLAQAIMGDSKNLVFNTDAYKLSMALMGRPLATETFYLTFRRGKGPWYNPFDLREVVTAMLDFRVEDVNHRNWLASMGYPVTDAMAYALTLGGQVSVRALPAGCWFGPREPIVTITGPSFLVSHLEALLLMLHYPLQVATAMAQGVIEFPVVCDTEADIVAATNGAMARLGTNRGITARDAGKAYETGVRERVERLADLLGDNERFFEVGLRSAVSMEHHDLALTAAAQGGLKYTSNLASADWLGMMPVGTTGHEHQQRFGNDRSAFGIQALCMEKCSFLFDTWDPVGKGIPAVLDVATMMDRPFSVRYDSGDHVQQYLLLRDGLKDAAVTHIFEDGYDFERTQQMEYTTDGGPKVKYGYGGFIIAGPHPSPFKRDAVSAAYKLSQSHGVSTYKQSGSPGKSSVPGVPLLLTGPEGERVIGQLGEPFFKLPWGRQFWTDGPPDLQPAHPSPATQAILTDINRSL